MEFFLFNTLSNFRLWRDRHDKVIRRRLESWRERKEFRRNLRKFKNSRSCRRVELLAKLSELSCLRFLVRADNYNHFWVTRRRPAGRAVTRQRSACSPCEKTSSRYLHTRHPRRNEERSIALRSPSRTERGKSSERPVSGSARESALFVHRNARRESRRRREAGGKHGRNAMTIRLPPENGRAKSTRRRYTTVDRGT